MGCLVTPVTIFSSSLEKDVKKIYSREYINQILQTVPHQKATVGVLLLYSKGEKSYLLLGREREDRTSKEAKGFSDLGGTTQKGTFLENALRELKEESAGIFNFFSPSKHNLFLEKSTVILTTNPETNRTIIYLIYPLEPQGFKSSHTLDQARKELQKDPSTPSFYLEKDLYLWVNLEDLCYFSLHKKENQNSLMVRTLDGPSQRIHLRSFFIKDFLKDRTFQKICTSKLKNSPQ